MRTEPEGDDQGARASVTRALLGLGQPTSPDATAVWAALGLAFIGAAFVVRYGGEVTPFAWPAALVFAAVYVGAVRLARRSGADPRWLEAALVLVALALALLSPETNGVARLPALDVWLDRITSGSYPYDSPIRPSGFPVLFALALPFWSVGLLPLLPVAGLVVFLAVLRWAAPEARLAALLGLALLPSVHYELVVHSELFLNAALALGSLWVCERARHHPGALAAAAVLVGLLLSTRLFVGVVYAVYGAYAFRAACAFRAAWGRGAVFAGIALAVWAATWVPFALWDPARFAAFGPFAVQSLYLPTGAIVASVVGALALGWTAASTTAVAVRVGWLLLGLVALSFALDLAQREPGAVIFDAAYFVLPTPFLLVGFAHAHASTLDPP